MIRLEGKVNRKMKSQEGHTVVIDVYLTRGVVTLLILALLAACVAAYLSWGQREATAAGSQAPLVTASTGMRQYYITRDSAYDGAHALTACDNGYHMASLWEILDPSNLTYNVGKGYIAADSGHGPPAGPGGWIRTGLDSVSSSNAGYASCHAWTRGDGADYGSTVWLGGMWNGDPRDIHVWESSAMPCSVNLRVWCVKDNVGSKIYLPLLIRSL